MRRTLLVSGLLVVLAVAIAALAIGLAGRDGDAAPAAGSGVGRPVPVEPYAAPAIEGDAVDGSGPLGLADLAGRPVIVNFWGSWCAPCRDEFPELKAFAAAHPEVALLGVSVEESAADARAFMVEQGATWPSISSPDGAIGRSYRLIGYPETFAIDGRGRVVARITGPADVAGLEEAARLAGAP